MRSEFEKLLKQHKDALTDELVKLGKHRQVQLAEWDIEQNETDYEFYFNGAWNAQQSKIDELQKRVDALSNLIQDHLRELNECYESDKENKFEYWRGFSHSAGTSAKRLRQALKGNN